MARYCHYCGKILASSAEARKHIPICFKASTDNYKDRVKKGLAGESPYMEKDNDRK